MTKQQMLDVVIRKETALYHKSYAEVSKMTRQEQIEYYAKLEVLTELRKELGIERRKI